MQCLYMCSCIKFLRLDYIEPYAKYNIYPVTVSNAVALPGGMASSVRVTRNSTNEEEKGIHGFFAVASSESLDANDLTASDNMPYRDFSEITVNNATHAINVTYVATANEEKKIAFANQLLDNVKGVGYPLADATVRTELQTAVSTSTDVDNKITNFINTSVTAINYPEDGKAYTLSFITNGGRKYYLINESNKYSLVETIEPTNVNYPESAVLIARILETDNKFAFVNTSGKFLRWEGTDYTNGCVNDYDAATTWFELKKMIKSGSQAKLFGTVSALGYRGTNKKSNLIYKVTESRFDQADATQYFDATYTSAILIEPVATVTYTPQPPMNNSEGAISEEIKKVATYSAPFATVVPDNVTAYYVSASEGAGGQATLVAWPATNGQQVLPASTGVILTSTDADATLAALTPATSETVNELPSGSNLLQNTATEPHIFAADEGFILAKGTYGVGLYKAKAGSKLARNKAYLTYSNPSQSASTAVRMVIGGNTPTDITHLMPQEDVDEQAPIYDLSGRRVQHTVKGGLYIRNGRKFIVR